MSNQIEVRTLLEYSGYYCIYGFISSSDKKIYLGYTSDLLSAATRHIKQSKDGLHNCKALQSHIASTELVIIESFNASTSHINYLMPLRLSYWIHRYEKEGYSILNNKGKSRGTPYRIRVNIVPNVFGPSEQDKVNHTRSDSTYLFEVRLASPSYNADLIVGVFDKRADTDSFVSRYYPDINFIETIVIANNDLTKNYVDFINQVS